MGEDDGPPALMSMESSRSLKSTGTTPSLVSYGDDDSIAELFDDDEDDDSSADSFSNHNDATAEDDDGNTPPTPRGVVVLPSPMPDAKPRVSGGTAYQLHVSGLTSPDGTGAKTSSPSATAGPIQVTMIPTPVEPS